MRQSVSHFKVRIAVPSTIRPRRPASGRVGVARARVSAKNRAKCWGAVSSASARCTARRPDRRVCAHFYDHEMYGRGRGRGRGRDAPGPGDDDDDNDDDEESVLPMVPLADDAHAALLRTLQALQNQVTSLSSRLDVSAKETAAAKAEAAKAARVAAAAQAAAASQAAAAAQAAARAPAEDEAAVAHYAQYRARATPDAHCATHAEDAEREEGGTYRLGGVPPSLGRPRPPKCRRVDAGAFAAHQELSRMYAEASQDAFEAGRANRVMLAGRRAVLEARIAYGEEE